MNHEHNVKLIWACQCTTCRRVCFRLQNSWRSDVALRDALKSVDRNPMCPLTLSSTVAWLGDDSPVRASLAGRPLPQSHHTTCNTCVGVWQMWWLYCCLAHVVTRSVSISIVKFQACTGSGATSWTRKWIHALKAMRGPNASALFAGKIRHQIEQKIAFWTNAFLTSTNVGTSRNNTGTLQADRAMILGADREDREVLWFWSWKQHSILTQSRAGSLPLERQQQFQQCMSVSGEVILVQRHCVQRCDLWQHAGLARSKEKTSKCRMTKRRNN